MSKANNSCKLKKAECFQLLDASCIVVIQWLPDSKFIYILSFSSCPFAWAFFIHPVLLIIHLMMATFSEDKFAWVTLQAVKSFKWGDN